MTNETQKDPVDINRRRLTKGGLAAPIVLATLASKNALAGPAFNCTISGKLSGGSVNRTASSCDLGRSGRDWLSILSNTTGTPGARKLAELNPIGQFTSPYDLKTRADGTFRIVAADVANPAKRATVNEILRYASGSPSPVNLTYAKRALSLYLNAEELNGATGLGHDFYPLNTTEAKDMFNAIVAGTGYSGTTSQGSFTWTNTELKSFIDLLYY